MTDDVRNLIRFVVDGDIRNAQTQCRIMLEKNVPEKDARFKEAELKKLNLLKPELIQLPANLESLLIAENATNFPESRFLLREEEETVINKLLATRKAALAIKELGINDMPIKHSLTEYGLIAPDGTWYACEFGEHAALAGRIIMRNREAFGLSDHEVLNMAYDWSGKGLDFLYKRGWIAIRNPSMGKTFLDMDETRTATKAQVNTIFDYISKFNRYDMNVSKVMAD